MNIRRLTRKEMRVLSQPILFEKEDRKVNLFIQPSHVNTMIKAYQTGLISEQSFLGAHSLQIVAKDTLRKELAMKIHRLTKEEMEALPEPIPTISRNDITSAMFSVEGKVGFFPRTANPDKTRQECFNAGWEIYDDLTIVDFRGYWIIPPKIQPLAKKELSTYISMTEYLIDQGWTIQGSDFISPNKERFLSAEKLGTHTVTSLARALERGELTKERIIFPF